MSVELPSVTSVLSVLDRPALLAWAVQQTARAAVRDRAAWEGILESSGEEEAVRWLAGARFRKDASSGLSATELGSEVHAAVERWLLEGQEPSKEKAGGIIHVIWANVAAWIDAHCSEIVASESTVFSLNGSVRYAGTLDLIVRLHDGRLALVDLKTSKDDTLSDGSLRRPWPEVALQLAAYRHAEKLLPTRGKTVEKARAFKRMYRLTDDEIASSIPMPEVDLCLGLTATPERADAYEVEAGEQEFHVFCRLLEIAHWQWERSKSVVAEHPARLEKAPDSVKSAAFSRGDSGKIGNSEEEDYAEEEPF